MSDETRKNRTFRQISAPDMYTSTPEPVSQLQTRCQNSGSADSSRKFRMEGFPKFDEGTELLLRRGLPKLTPEEDLALRAVLSQRPDRVYKNRHEYLNTDKYRIPASVLRLSASRQKYHFFTALRYSESNGTLKQIKMIRGEGQDFRTYATPWEKRNSPLALYSKPRVPLPTPIVDRTGLVVGYFATAKSPNLLIPRDVYFLNKDNPQVYLDAGVPVLYESNLRVTGDLDHIHWETRWKMKNKWLEMKELKSSSANTHSISQIMTDISGNLIDVLSSGHSESGLKDTWQVDDLIDLVLIGKAVAKGLLRYTLKRVAKSKVRVLIRKGGKRIRNVFTEALQKSGMTKKHFKAAQEVVDEMAERGKKLFVLFRPTGPKPAKLIDLGCPSKGPNISTKTIKETGIVTAIQKKEFSQAWKEGYHTIKSFKNGTAIAVKEVGNETVEITIKNPFWKVEVGQLIDPKLKKPLTGDYDALAVINANAPGRNLADVSTGVKNFSDPLTDEFTKLANLKMGSERVLHSGQHKLLSKKSGGLVPGEGALLLQPNQPAIFLNEQQLKQFLTDIGHPTIMGTHKNVQQGIDFAID